jgi:hypothetical protein
MLLAYFIQSLFILKLHGSGASHDLETFILKPPVLNRQIHQSDLVGEGARCPRRLKRRGRKRAPSKSVRENAF